MVLQSEQQRSWLTNTQRQMEKIILPVGRDEMAGKRWYYDFMKSHAKSISLRAPQATSLARSTSFNKENVGLFFSKLEKVYNRAKLTPGRIWNTDETGISTVHAPPRIIAEKGAKQVGGMTSGERGSNVTMITAVNTIGNHIPPMLIFPRVNYKHHMLKGAPVGAIGGANESGWSNEHLFMIFLQHFLKHAKPTQQVKALLILDNHESHISIQAIDFAKANGLEMLTFPPHTSHKLQPLDRSAFGPFKKYYSSAASQWMLSYPGKPISIYEVAELVGQSFPKAFTPSSIQSGFRVSGIFPFNKEIFREDEFLSSYVTDRPLEQSTESRTPDRLLEQSTETRTPDRPLEPSTESRTPDRPLEQSTESRGSTSLEMLVQPSTSNAQNERQTPKTLEEICPFPKAPPRKNVRANSRKGKTRILTDTPEKMELGAAANARQQKKNKRPRTQNAKKRTLFKDSNEINTHDDAASLFPWPESDEYSEADCETDDVLNDNAIEKGNFV